MGVAQAKMDARARQARCGTAILPFAPTERRHCWAAMLDCMNTTTNLRDDLMKLKDKKIDLVAYTSAIHENGHLQVKEEVLFSIGIGMFEGYKKDLTLHGKRR